MKNYMITEWCRHFMELQVKPGDLCIDATAGNGHDTEFLCRLVGENGQVLAFDIQKDALQHTKDRLDNAGLLPRTQLIQNGHEHLADYAEPDSVSCIVFNFGYLPGGDHTIATRPDTSIRAVHQALSLLKKGGLLSLCIYSGGDSGFAERDALLEELKVLDSRKYLVIRSDYYNRKNNPPIPVLVIKLR